MMDFFKPSGGALDPCLYPLLIYKYSLMDGLLFFFNIQHYNCLIYENNYSFLLSFFSLMTWEHFSAEIQKINCFNK
jgi:hypothetical protein